MMESINLTSTFTRGCIIGINFWAQTGDDQALKFLEQSPLVDFRAPRSGVLYATSVLDFFAKMAEFRSAVEFAGLFPNWELIDERPRFMFDFNSDEIRARAGIVKLYDHKSQWIYAKLAGIDVETASWSSNDDHLFNLAEILIKIESHMGPNWIRIQHSFVMNIIAEFGLTQ